MGSEMCIRDRETTLQVHTDKGDWLHHVQTVDGASGLTGLFLKFRFFHRSPECVVQRPYTHFYEINKTKKKEKLKYNVKNV